MQPQRADGLTYFTSRKDTSKKKKKKDPRRRLRTQTHRQPSNQPEPTHKLLFLQNVNRHHELSCPYHPQGSASVSLQPRFYPYCCCCCLLGIVPKRQYPLACEHTMERHKAGRRSHCVTQRHCEENRRRRALVNRPQQRQDETSRCLFCCRVGAFFCFFSRKYFEHCTNNTISS